jgi:hypothetical protein
MAIKKKIKRASLGAGFIGATTLADIGIAGAMNVPLLVVVPIGVAAGAIGARQLIKELKEEKGRKRLKKVI